MLTATALAREADAVATATCPRVTCQAPPGKPCRYLRGLYATWESRAFKHPHPERLARLAEWDRLADVIAYWALAHYGAGNTTVATGWAATSPALAAGHTTTGEDD